MHSYEMLRLAIAVLVSFSVGYLIRHDAPSGARRQALALGTGTYVCPWDAESLGRFTLPDHAVDFGSGLKVCMDTIIFGYDLIFERNQHFGLTKWLEEMLWDLRPEVVIELGTNRGGGALFFASIMSLYSDTAKVITIDPKHFHEDWWKGKTRYSDQYPCLPADDHRLWNKSVTYIQGIPTDPAIVDQVAALIKGAKRVMVSEDSSHDYSVVLSNARAYAKFVSPGQYLLIQDTKLTRFHKRNACDKHNNYEACIQGKNGPGDAAVAFLAENPDFVVDTTYEFLWYSQHAKGWLRRV